MCSVQATPYNMTSRALCVTHHRSRQITDQRFVICDCYLTQWVYKYIYIYIYTHTHIYVYIYIERERLYMMLYVYIYIYIGAPLV